MLDNCPLIGAKETAEVIQSGQVQSLKDIHNIEAALVFIQQSTKKIEDFKEIKRKRTELIDVEISNLEQRVEFLKSVIIETLKEANQKNVTFPGVGKASQRNKKGKWIVTDESSLIKVLKETGEDKNILETKESIKKTELNKLLDMWNKIGKVPTSCIEKEKDTDSVAITFEEENESGVNTPTITEKKNIKDLGEFDLDELNFVGSKV